MSFYDKVFLSKTKENNTSAKMTETISVFYVNKTPII